MAAKKKPLYGIKYRDMYLYVSEEIPMRLDWTLHSTSAAFWVRRLNARRAYNAVRFFMGPIEAKRVKIVPLPTRT
jgi:hypothetical protein